MQANVAVIAAHPDDEILGCGGAMARHMRAGDDVHVLILAEGITSRDEIRDTNLRAGELSALVNAANRANEIVGTKSLQILDYPDNRMDSIDRLQIIKSIEAFLEEKQPTIVYTHNISDLNIDHRRVHECVVTACRPVPESIVEQLLFFEVPSSSEWQTSITSVPCANWFVDISDTLDIKLDALGEYAAEMRDWPHPRSIEGVTHLAKWRGASVGVDAAEAFILGRMIRK